MALPAKLGIALVVALASNASLFSMLLFPGKHGTTSTISTPTIVIATTTVAATSDGNGNNGVKFRNDKDEVKKTDSDQMFLRDAKILSDDYHKEELEVPVGEQSGTSHFGDVKGDEQVEVKKVLVRAPSEENSFEELDTDHEDLRPLPERDPASKRDLNTGSKKGPLNLGYAKIHHDSEPGNDSESTSENIHSESEMEVLELRSENYLHHGSENDTHLGSELRPLSEKNLNPGSEKDKDPGHEESDSDGGSETEDSHPEFGKNRNSRSDNDPRYDRGDLDPEHNGAEGNSMSRPLEKAATSHRLNKIIASLTDMELQQFHPNTAKVLIPPLRRLERVVLRELERLHAVGKHQESRLQRLENTQIPKTEVAEAVKVIREEQRKLEQLKHKEELTRQLSPRSAAPSGIQQSNSSQAQVIPGLEADDSLEQVDSGDGSGSGDETLTVFETTVAMTTRTTSPARKNTTQRSDEAIINHIYEMYNSLTSMEHKVLELDTRLTSVTSEVYRQRATFVRMEDKVEDMARNQKTLVMRSTVHGFKLSDLEQFKGHAEQLLGSAEGTIEKMDTKLEIFMDRMMAQQDEVEIMRNVFSRLDQVSNELRTADAFKAHDIQELMRGYQQVDTRLNDLYNSLDQSVGNIRWDVKTYLDHLCSNNNLQC